jgi:hypothetical protein
MDSLKRKVLGEREYEIFFARDWDIDQKKLPSGVELVAKNARSLSFRTDIPEEINPMILQILAKEKAPVLTLQEKSRSLEQVYLKVMADAQAGEKVQ